MRTWIIGSAADCDLVVARPTVSGRHCRLTETPDGFLLEDLGSSNGTHVNRERIAAPTRVTAGDSVTLGLSILMPWPVVAGAPGVTVIRIGRNADNDIVLDDVRVSGHHARLLIVPGSKTLIEDAGSSNGTFLNSPDQRITRAVLLSKADVVYFGSLAVPAARFSSARPEPETSGPPPIPTPSPAPEVPPLSGPVALPPVSVPVVDDRWAALLLVQAPVVAILIVLIFGGQAAATINEANWASVARSIAATTFVLGMAAIWLGASLAVWSSRAGRREGRLFVSPAARHVTLAALCIVQSAVLLTIVYWGSGLRGDWLAMFGVLVMAMGVGLSFGLVVFALSRSPATTLGILLMSFLPMIALGGWIWTLPKLGPPLRPMAAMMPSRWAFEGLLLLESERRAPSGPAEGSARDRAHDLAESDFPAQSERMGVLADVMALGFMLIGLSAAAAFLSWNAETRSKASR